MDTQQIVVTASDFEQTVQMIQQLLAIAGLAGFFLGFMAGWILRNRYDFRQWLKHGIYCDDCAPVVHHDKTGHD